ncbi:MAG: YicC family protein [Gammaproteobacteria bacterium]|nr:YicC family protein [Gammaproteobacteria bacterium]
MPHSMTGYARLEANVAEGVLTWEVRTVNHRYLELSLRLPEEFRPLQSKARQQVQQKLKRGKVDANLFFQKNLTADQSMVIDDAVLQQLNGARQQLMADKDACLEPTWLEILRWPGMIRESSIDLEKLETEVVQLLDRTLQQLADARAREGEQLAQTISQRGQQLKQQVDDVQSHLPSARTAIEEKLKMRLRDIAAEFDSQRFEQETVYLLQKMDVAEELDRLNVHIGEVDKTLAGDEPVGRRLDFLMQELNREANTLASKSQDHVTTAAAVEAKVLIEQMREQVQNLE